MNCRHCHNPLEHLFLNLGRMPPSNAYVDAGKLAGPETAYPLRVFICDRCWLAQTEDFTVAGELFGPDYAYFSSVSSSWCAHAKAYVSMITRRLSLHRHSFVIELASNDGYLLRHFVQADIPCLGIEPTDCTADAAEQQDVPVLREFFGAALGERLAREGRRADLVLGNNVYAHVPDINDFTAGIQSVLKPTGTLTLEFPHLLCLLRDRQFDTVYHEHFSYLSLIAVKSVFEAVGLRIYDVEKLPTHGGSLRVYGCHVDDPRDSAAGVETLLAEEREAGLTDLETYLTFQQEAEHIRDTFRAFLEEQQAAGKKVVAYGAAAKGNTLLNYAGITPELLPVVYDAADSKQGKYLPGSHIPVRSPEELKASRPDYVVILPWNIAGEIVESLYFIRDQGGRFVTFVPEKTIW
jgi:SAM-dependent methyltransferase